MQKLSEEKRRAILRSAEGLFARRPFHEVHLDDIAAAARVGKGTLYVYFPGKDELYLELVGRAMDGMLLDLAALAADEDLTAWEALRGMIGRLAGWAAARPDLFDMLRSGALPVERQRIRRRRRRVGELFEKVLKRGKRSGELGDIDAHLTAQIIPGMVRSGVVWGKKGLGPDELTRRILRLLEKGIGPA